MCVCVCVCVRRKRYERAEKEFVAAKMALVEKSDVKESLTEHLYTIIQQNEARKAERLAVLMKELGLEGEQWPTPLTVPPLLSFSPINTLHRPGFPPSPSSNPPTAPYPAQAAVSENTADESCRGDAGQVSQARTDEQDQEKQSSLQAELASSTERDVSKLNDSGDGKSGVTSVSVGDEQGKEKEKEKGLDGESEDGAKVDKQKQSSPTETGSPESQDGGADAQIVAS